MSSSRDWAAKRLAEHSQVVAAEPRGDSLIDITRKGYESFCTAILKEPLVIAEILESMYSSDIEVQFVANIPKDGIWKGDAIEFAHHHNWGWGGFGDLMSAINEESVSGFQKKEYAFCERCIKQHTRVQNYERIFDRVFKISRKALPDIKVALAYEYELTAEHVRSAVEKYGEFSLIAKTNPNGNVTGNAQKVAKNLGIEVLEWGEFLGRLNRV